ncbi:hypothetical protein [Polyangium jinanense]|uniref:Uncharacterized protein n=1 Tax=Polyangium jinanense TaxID=2829994 RepID=A0A9X3X389_9BACT|nr:hypothetical protein [Polyangium jinanense]MDC3956065.1 hypothetical protein [Polyangium jinanense]MDC3982904.1 hypothetical protein [Polyangium jinanense]
MIGLRLVGNLPVAEPNEDRGLITWLHCVVYESSGHNKDECEDDDEEDIGSVLIALIHVEEASRLNVSLLDALDAEDAEFETIYSVYFDDDWFKDEYAQGRGSDLLYIAEMSIDDAYRKRNVDLAVIRRLCTTFAAGCELVVMPYTSEDETKRWSTLGFVVSTEGQPSGLMHLQQASGGPRVVDFAGNGRFRVLPNVEPRRLRKMD